MKRICRVAVLVMIVAASAALAAIEKRPLPEFTLNTFDGEPILSTSLTAEGRWLLVYVHAGCGSCTTVLRAIGRDEHPGLASRVVVVVGGATAAQAAAIRQAATELVDARWVIDADRSTERELRLGAVPTVIGMRDSRIEWSLTGVFQSETEMTSILVSWLTR